jgi:cyanate permease
MAEDLSAVTTPVLEGRLKAALAVQRTVTAIFAVIIAAWLALGYWKSNVPVFISTVAMGVAISAMTSIAPRAVKAELKRRNTPA